MLQIKRISIWQLVRDNMPEQALVAYYVLREKIVVPLKNASFASQYRKQDRISLCSTCKCTLFYNGIRSGGTMTFVRNFLKETTDKKIVVIRPAFAGKGCNFFILEDGINGHECIMNKEDLLECGNLLNINEIIVNSLAGFENILSIIDIIKTQTERLNVPLRIFFHDYFALCPNLNIEKNNGLKCYERCSFIPSCKSYFFRYIYRSIPHNEWMLQWKGLLDIATELRVFSLSSAEIIGNFYNIPMERFTIKPHSMQYFQDSPLIGLATQYLHIGIIGGITSEMKGMRVVHEFLKFAERNHVRVTIIGKYQYYIIGAHYVNATGSYNCGDLGKIIRERGINVAFFPSVCPETFSYVVSELMQLGMPIVCFDYGAQAEKVRNYERGMICSSEGGHINPADIINCAEILLKKLG